MKGDVFIVDDNPNNLSFLSGILREGGYEVRVAQSGRRAIVAVMSRPPELILLDVNMPEMNGYEVCAKLKADPRSEDVPVIFLSALDDVKDKVAAFQAGGVDYVTKPFHAEEVIARVETQLKLARMRRSLEEKNLQLAKKNQELEQAWRNTEHVFTALTDVLKGAVLNGKYRLEDKIGMGGFAAIYRGRHLALDKPVAVKILKLDPARDAGLHLERFRLEGISATRVSHPNAVSVLDSGITASGIAYLVMELLEGRSLAHELDDEGPRSLARCAEVMTPVCDVLARAHASGIIHRDIKPGNIFLHHSEAGEVVKVVDFGIAALYDAGRDSDVRTTIGRLVGTPVYMSPERILGKPYDGRADTYSVGMTLYEMLSGRFPFEMARPGQGALGAIIMACLTEEPIPLRSFLPLVPEAVDRAVLRALAKEPGKRPTVQDLAGELQTAVVEAPPALRAARGAGLMNETVDGGVTTKED